MLRGLFIGRFQPFHLGHLKDIKDALKEVDELIIGIGSSQEKNTKDNPFSVEERLKMIEFVLNSENIFKRTIFPIPDFNDDEKWSAHIIKNIPKFDIIYTGNDWTERCFKNKGYKIKKIKLIPGINSTIIRNRILKGEDWHNLVPLSTALFLEKIKGVEKIKNVLK